MSVIRPKRLDRSFELYGGILTGHPTPFTPLQGITIDSVVPGGATITINFTDPNAGADLTYYGYALERRIDGGDWVEVAKFGSGVIHTTYDDTTWSSVVVPVGHNYEYRIMSFNRFAETPWSNTGSAVVPSTFNAPILSPLVRTDNEVALTWDHNGNTYATGEKIEIFKDVNSTGYLKLAEIVKTASAAMPTTYTEAFDFFTMVPATYSYKVRANRGVQILGLDDNIGPFSNSQSEVVNFSLLAPTALTAVMAVGNTQVNLTWTDPNPPGDEIGIKVDRQTGSGVFVQVAALPPGTAAYSDVFTTESGEAYTYRVRAYNSLHDGPNSITATATASLLIPQITDLSQAADIGIRIAWADENERQTGYTIERSIDNGLTWDPVGTTAGDVRWFTDFTTLSIGRIITYRIKATNATTASAWGSSSITISKSLVAPQDLTPVFVEDGLIRVTWRGMNPVIRGAKVYRSINGAAYALVASLTQTTRSYDDRFQTYAGAVYVYKVAEYNNIETGPESDQVATSSTLDAPISLTVVSIVGEWITLAWEFGTNPFDFYVADYVSIERAFGDGAYAEVGRSSYIWNATSFRANLNGGVPGDVVRFRIRKIRETKTIFGNVTVPKNYGDYSDSVSTASPLAAPTGVTVTRPSAGTNLVSWSDTNVNHAGYKIFRQIIASGVYGQIAPLITTTDPATHFIYDKVSGPIPSIYRYWVAAYNADNTSPLSAMGWIPTRLPALYIEATQPLRRRVRLDALIPTVYFPVPGDVIRVMRSKNNGVIQVLANIPGPFTTGFLLNDDDVEIGDSISYSAVFIAANEYGEPSNAVLKIVDDLIPMPLNDVRQIRINGSRTGGVQRPIFAACQGGIVKVTEDQNTHEPVIETATGSYLTGASSVVCGDKTRVVAFTGVRPKNVSEPWPPASAPQYATLLDADTLAVLGSENLYFTKDYYCGGIGSQFVWQTFDIGLFGDIVCADQGGGTSGIYTGWAFSTWNAFGYRTNFGLARWSSDFSTITLAPATGAYVWDYYSNLGGLRGVGATDILIFQMTVIHLAPERMENLGADVVYFSNIWADEISIQSDKYTVSNLFRTHRSQNTSAVLLKIPEYVADFVTDSVSKVIAVTVRGHIYGIDLAQYPDGITSVSPTNPSNPMIGRSVATLPIAPIDPVKKNIYDINTDFVKIELAGSKLIISYSRVGSPATTPLGFPNGSTKIFVYSIQGRIGPNMNLTLDRTFEIKDMIKGLASDGGKYLYANSADNQRLFRFDLTSF